MLVWKSSTVLYFKNANSINCNDKSVINCLYLKWNIKYVRSYNNTVQYILYEYNNTNKTKKTLFIYNKNLAIGGTPVVSARGVRARGRARPCWLKWSRWSCRWRRGPSGQRVCGRRRGQKQQGPHCGMWRARDDQVDPDPRSEHRRRRLSRSRSGVAGARRRRAWSHRRQQRPRRRRAACSRRDPFLSRPYRRRQSRIAMSRCWHRRNGLKSRGQRWNDPSEKAETLNVVMKKKNLQIR